MMTSRTASAWLVIRFGLGLPFGLGLMSCGGATGGHAPDAAPEARASSPEVTPDVAPEAARDLAAPDVATPDAAAPDAVLPDVAAAPEAATPDAASDAVEAAPAVLPYRALTVTIGEYHSCALLEDHKVKCWGDNSIGQLGLGDMRTRGLLASDMGDALPTVDLGTGRTATALAAGRYATCAILDNGALKCWGHPWPSFARGSQPGQMGDNLPVVDLGAGRTAKKIVIGFYDACVLRDDDTLRCWGTSNEPADVALPMGAKLQEPIASASVLGLFSDGTVRGPLSAAVSPAVPIDLGAGELARAVAGSATTNCALLQSGGLTCWGARLESTPPKSATGLVALAMTSLAGNTCALLLDGSVRCWGAEAASAAWSAPSPTGQAVAGFPVKLRGPAAAIAGGAYFYTCALLRDGSVSCWVWGGNTPVAALGVGDTGLVNGALRTVDLGTRPTL